MTQPSSPPKIAAATAAPTALAAFLRGVERRGAVLAELQAGSAVDGDAALAAAMRAFHGSTSAQPLAQWPRRFWSLVLAAPQLRGRPLAPVAEDDMAWLARLDPGSRAALLLRLAAGLSEADAAATLAVSPAAYRQALQRALPRHQDGRADPAAWRRLREGVHRRIKTLPAPRLAHLASLREGALAQPADSGTRRARRRHPRWLLPLLWLLLAICAAGMAATFAWPQLGLPWQHDARDGIRREALPPAAPPVARFGDGTALLSHRDFDLLADPDGMAAARDLAFFSWLAAQPDSGDLAATEADDAN